MPKGKKTVVKGGISCTLQLPCGKIYQGNEKTIRSLQAMHAKSCDPCAKALVGKKMVLSTVHSAPGMTSCDELAHNIKAKEAKLSELKLAPHIKTLTTANPKAVNWQLIEE